MARTTTIPEFKAALAGELTRVCLEGVQVSYAIPVSDQHRRQSIYLGEEVRTAGTPEQRISDGRRKRFAEYELDVIARCSHTARPEDVEARAFEIAGTLESLLADDTDTRTWECPVDGIVSVLLDAVESVLTVTGEGTPEATVTTTLIIKERLV